MNWFARWLTHRPAAVLIAHGLVTLVLGFFALQVRIESSIESVLPAGDPSVQYYADIRGTFGSDDVAVIGVRADDLFSESTLEKIQRITERVAEIEGVEQVVSLTNVTDPTSDVFEPPPLLPHLPLRPGELDVLQAKLRELPVYARNLVASDLKGAAINVFFENLTDAQYRDLRIDQRILGVLAEVGGPERFYFTGAGRLKTAAVELMRRDLYVFTPIAFALVLVVLAVSFRTVRGVMLPLVSVVIAIIWTLGLMVLMGKSITLGTFVLPPLLLVLGSSYGIHVMTRYGQTEGSPSGRQSAATRALEEAGVPVLISALTTMVGFGSLMVNRITAIWDLGLFAAIGLGFLIITSLALLPAALHVLPPRSAARSGASPALAVRLGRLGRAAFARRNVVVICAVIVSALALLGARRIRVDSDFLSYFDPSSEVRRANEVINSEIVASNPFYLVVEGTGPALLEKWEVLRQIKDLQSFLLTLPGITSSISIVDYLELLEKGLQKSAEGDILIDEHGQIVEGAPKSFWENPANLEPVLALIRRNPAAFKSVVTADLGKGNLIVRTKLSGSRDIEETLARVRAYIAERFPAQVLVRPTGNLVLLTGTTSDIVLGQIKSLALALGVIFVVMSLMFLSVRVGLLAIVPNALPIVIFFGVMGWGGILLNLGTSLIAAIALGIAVDSTVHYMTRLNFELKGETDQAAALARTMESVGLPIVYSTAALFFGFLIFAFSSFVPIQNFGVLTGATLATALGTNLVLLPALLAGVKIITLWDLVGVKLGEDPTRTIPLFSGLRPGQARIVVLMGQIKRFGSGEAIIRRGEMGSEMYVVIQGNAEVWGGSGAERRKLIELKRGDVVGEMALVRHNERSADVIAVGAVEVLAVDERFLSRIQSRYPRIASKVFLNLTRILSDRLERTTQRFVAAH